MINYIINGNSNDVLKRIPENFVDLIITSPPYNAGHDYDIYDDNKEIDEYLELLKNIFSKCFNVLKDDGKICVNVPFAIKNMKTKGVMFLATKIASILNEIGFKDFEMITWHKGKNINHFQGNNTAWGSWKSPSCPNCRPMCESIMVFYKKERSHTGDKNNIDITADEFKDYTKNSWYINEDNIVYDNLVCEPNINRKDQHPAPYPVELIERLIKLYSYKNDIILDPFNGIGTTTLAAAKLERQYIGIELSESYCDLAIAKMFNYKPIKISYNDDFAKLVNSDANKNNLNTFFPYKESFSPDLLDYLNDIRLNKLIDPFMGTGSSFMSKYADKSECYGFDTNPLSIEITKAKLIKLSIDGIKSIEKVANDFSSNDIKIFKFPEWKPYTKYVNQEKFNIVKSFIESFSKLGNDEFRYVKYLVISNLQDIFDYKRDGNGIKYRKSKLSINNTIVYLKKIIKDSLLAKRMFDKANKRRLFINQSSSTNEFIIENADCAITSPPYCNMFDYFEVYKVELWTSELVTSYEQWAYLKKTAMRSNKNAAINNDCIVSNILNAQIAELQKKQTDQGTINKINNYFFDINKVLNNMSSSLKIGSKFFIIVGNSFYSGVPIPTDEIIAELACKHNFKLLKIMIARKLSTSSQQLKILQNIDRVYLRESIVVLERI